MSPRTAYPEFDTFAEVVRALGDIPLDRILWNPHPGTATEADQLRFLHGEPKRLVELVEGILVEKPMGHRESLFAISLGFFLMRHVRPRNLGVIGAPDAILRMANGRNRIPDLYFIRWENLPDATAHLEVVAHYCGDLMIEILSSGNTRREIDAKRRDYFVSGCQLIWVVDPETRTVSVFDDPTTPDHAQILRETDTLTGGSVLPEFALPLVELFQDPQLNPRAGSGDFVNATSF
ncbi:MAG: Uma2 family endonuclease [Bacteroidales bacterium]|nr:Uma2 family endonuclease [Bacteroidales bacterium]